MRAWARRDGPPRCQESECSLPTPTDSPGTTSRMTPESGRRCRPGGGVDDESSWRGSLDTPRYRKARRKTRTWLRLSSDSILLSNAPHPGNPAGSRLRGSVDGPRCVCFRGGAEPCVLPARWKAPLRDAPGAGPFAGTCFPNGPVLFIRERANSAAACDSRDAEVFAGGVCYPFQPFRDPASGRRAGANLL